MLSFSQKPRSWVWLLASEAALLALLTARLASGERDQFTRLLLVAAAWVAVSLLVDILFRIFRASSDRRTQALWLVGAGFLAWTTYFVRRLAPYAWIAAVELIVMAWFAIAGGRAFGRSGRYGYGGIAVVLGAIAVTRIAGEIYNLSTTLVSIAALACAVLLASDRLSSWLKLERDTQASLRLMWSTVFLLIVLLEFVLRFGLGYRVTYLEANNGGTYVSVRSTSRRALFVYNSNQEVRRVGTEFVHYRRTNSLGLAEQEIGVRTDPQEYRILALGDSFTEGVGAPYESTWVKGMEAVLATRMPQRRVVAINAGISGSDVCFEFKLLEDKLLSLDPQLVIVALNSSDVIDLSMRGGMERFLPDGTVRPVAAPWWERLYAVSYITRHVVHDVLDYNWSFVKSSEELARQREAVLKIRDVLGAFAALANRERFTFLVVLHPHQHEALAGELPSPFDELVQAVSKVPGIHLVDLVTYFRDRAGLTRANASEFYWPIDVHHTPKGYGVMGRAIAEAVLERGLIR